MIKTLTRKKPFSQNQTQSSPSNAKCDTLPMLAATFFIYISAISNSKAIIVHDKTRTKIPPCENDQLTKKTSSEDAQPTEYAQFEKVWAG